MRTDAAPSGSAAASLAEQCEEAAALVESVFAASPSGYKLDQALATYDDSVTYGELHTADLAVIAAAVVHSRGCTDVSSLAFCDAGSGVGKLAIAAGFVFATSLGVELAPERAAVADAGLAALAGCSTQAEGASGGVLAEEASDGVSARSGSGAAGGQRVRGRPCAARLVRGSFLDERLDSTDVLFVHNLVFSRALSRALEARLDQQLRAGAHAFAVGELRFSRRAVRAHPFELAARFGWADWQPRPLYHYVFEGDVTPPPAAGDEG